MKKLFLLPFILLLAIGINAQSTSKTKSHKSGSMSKECVMMQDGKMMTMKNGQSMPMDHDMTMKNGSIVMTDGTVKTKDGKTMTLKDGDYVWMSGAVTHKKMKGNTKKY